MATIIKLTFGVMTPTTYGAAMPVNDPDALVRLEIALA